jgi:flagellar biosynthesis protein
MSREPAVTPELAREHGVSVSRDPDLLAALEPLDVGRLIPPELFQAVALLLAALYRANSKLPGGPSA